MTNEITKPKIHTFGTGLHGRVTAAQTQQASIAPETMPNRLALMLDVSGSMRGQKITKLREALLSFYSTCNFTDTACCQEVFPRKQEWCVPLTTVGPMLITTSQMLEATDMTPMAQSMDLVLNTVPLTRGILMSDGAPDSADECYEKARLYAEAEIPIDCVHIGAAGSGEVVLRRIAEITGGVYIKFTDIDSFARNFKYLTPTYYAMLTSGVADDANEAAKLLGATEVK